MTIFNLNDRALGVIQSNNKKIYLMSSMLLVLKKPFQLLNCFFSD